MSCGVPHLIELGWTGSTIPCWDFLSGDFHCRVHARLSAAALDGWIYQADFSYAYPDTYAGNMVLPRPHISSWVIISTITSLKRLRSSSIGILIYRCFSAAVLHRPTEFMGLLNVNRSMLPNMGDRKFFTLMVLVWTMKEELNALLCGISFHSLTYGSFINTAKGSDGNARF